MNQQFYRQNQNPSILVLVITNEEHVINEILYQPGLGLSNHVCLYFNHLCYVKKCNRPTPRFNLHCANSDQLNNLLNSVDWEEVDAPVGNRVQGYLRLPFISTCVAYVFIILSVMFVLCLFVTTQIRSINYHCYMII